ncbi:MAG: hypothetical protein Q8K40_03200, partial [Ignavibacteria bacterium]|nr:hypothetical protein [Ignavibacteria bacterium]
MYAPDRYFSNIWVKYRVFPTFAVQKFNQMNTITIEGVLRTEHGKKAARQIRSQENVPGVIYGG